MQQSIPRRFQVRVFATEVLRGTSAVVYKVIERLSGHDMQRIAKEEAAPATCFIYQLNERQFEIRFYNTTHEIQLCGHGLLASAKVIAQDSQYESFNLLTRDSLVSCQYNPHQNNLEIAFRELKATEVSAPTWLSDCFNVKPSKVSKAGPEDGYWVMEWPRDMALSDLVVEPDILMEKTQRAVIATQQSSNSDYDYNFRYFAPQHGVLEDKATGSAHRVLVSYWHQHLNKCNFKARQYSIEGAELIGRIEGEDVWISGNVEIER
ncbi:PhzF family phenazine biosynthesis protein [Kangiella geojedonensis]|uniref:Phenazine biosynthesis PhzC/PhzF protein n=1 Tax=Kangiella geojedonensis TaxID=914150 RepID=A0A0F6TQV3_9GAMM|nr:PhzF family phenazine biosynthesis protein [Kangiella geojedonensis]AKE52240.1 Phenazine biosynthesis PhzC/PhzF protein [Kangiella geojedonensis]